MEEKERERNVFGGEREWETKYIRYTDLYISKYSFSIPQNDPLFPIPNFEATEWYTIYYILFIPFPTPHTQNELRFGSPLDRTQLLWNVGASKRT